MSNIVEVIKEDVAKLFQEAKDAVTKAKLIWKTFSSTANRSLALKLFTDAVKLVNDGTAVISAGGTNLALDAATLNDIKTIIADAKAGDTVIKADLALLGIVLK